MSAGPNDALATDQTNSETGRVEIPQGGQISQFASPLKVVLAVLLLIIVTIFAFVGAALIGDLIFVPTQLTFWIIEMIFALLCGGAGAIVGGSAAVRSTFNLPGNPVHATLGGAIAMILVGFAVAYIAQPKDDAPTYALEIDNIPEKVNVAGVEYKINVAPGSPAVNLTREAERALIHIPIKEDIYVAKIAVYTIDKDVATVIGRCDLQFVTYDSRAPSLAQTTLASGSRSSTGSFFHVDFDLLAYVPAVVADAKKAHAATTTRPCLFGSFTEAKRQSALSNRFVLTRNNSLSRLSRFASLQYLPPYSIAASGVSNNDPEDTTDLPPQATPAPGSSAKIAAAPDHTVLNPPLASGRSSSDAKPDASERPARSETISTVKADQSTIFAQAESNKQLQNLVDEYVNGKDFDRTPLYAGWEQVQDYVVQRLRQAASTNSPSAALYINLVSNALNVIQNGEYLPPSRRPGWDRSVKPQRLTFSKNIPGFAANDYAVVVSLLCNADTSTRRAAQRLMKLYPSNSFYAPLQKLSKPGNDANCDSEFIAESAVNYFYNRIVEYDGSFPLDAQSSAWVIGNYTNGNEWATRGKQGLDYAAMLKYAAGTVFWDHGDTSGRNYFEQMIGSLKNSNSEYPSNPQHIARALKIVYDSDGKMGSVDQARSYGPADQISVKIGYGLVGGQLPLFASPDPSSKQIGSLPAETSARRILRSDGRDLLRGGNQIGWATRSTITSAK